MKNFIGWGDASYLTAPANLVSGQFVVIGTMFGFAGANALSGARFALWTEGTYRVDKAAGVAWTEGQAIYWDAAALNFATTSTSGHVKVGVAINAALSADVLGDIRLNGAF